MWNNMWEIMWDIIWDIIWDIMWDIIWDIIWDIMWNNMWNIKWDIMWDIMWDIKWDIMWDIMCLAVRHSHNTYIGHWNVLFFNKNSPNFIFTCSYVAYNCDIHKLLTDCEVVVAKALVESNVLQAKTSVQYRLVSVRCALYTVQVA